MCGVSSTLSSESRRSSARGGSGLNTSMTAPAIARRSNASAAPLCRPSSARAGLTKMQFGRKSASSAVPIIPRVSSVSRAASTTICDDESKIVKIDRLRPRRPDLIRIDVGVVDEETHAETARDRREGSAHPAEPDNATGAAVELRPGKIVTVKVEPPQSIGNRGTASGDAPGQRQHPAHDVLGHRLGIATRAEEHWNPSLVDALQIQVDRPAASATDRPQPVGRIDRVARDGRQVNKQSLDPREVRHQQIHRPRVLADRRIGGEISSSACHRLYGDLPRADEAARRGPGLAAARHRPRGSRSGVARW